MSDALRVAALTQAHIPQALALFARAVAAMRAQGYKQWSAAYPNEAVLHADLAAGTVYGAFAGDTLLGVVTVDTREHPAYAGVPWQVRGGVYCVHRLAVDPAAQRGGVAHALMGFAEAHALRGGGRVIHLDTGADNLPAQALYERRGYARRGLVRLDERDMRFICYEKHLCGDCRPGGSL